MAPAAADSGIGDYYAWRRQSLAVGPQRVEVFTKPGAPGYAETDFPSLLIAEHVQAAEGKRVLVANSVSGVGGVAIALLDPSITLTLTDSNVVGVEAAAKTVAAGKLTARVIASSAGSHLADDEQFDTIAARLPKGKIISLRTIWNAFERLRPNGTFYLAGGNDEGIKTYLKHAAELFGNLTVIDYQKGSRIAVCRKPEAVTAVPEAFQSEEVTSHDFHRFTTTVRGRELTICSRPGVFSWDRLDDATAVLLEKIEIDPDDTVLDLGCGSGAIGMVAASIASRGSAVLVDVDIDAVDSASATVHANGVANATVQASDALAAVRNQRFTAVLTNPPFHLGKNTDYAMVQAFMQGAAAVLEPTGRMDLVANKFLPYEKYIATFFGAYEIVHQDNRFKVIRATKPRA